MDANVHDVPDAVKQRIMALQKRLTSKDSDNVQNNLQSPVDCENVTNIQGQMSAWQQINSSQNSAFDRRLPLISPDGLGTTNFVAGRALTKEVHIQPQSLQETGHSAAVNLNILTSPPATTTAMMEPPVAAAHTAANVHANSSTNSNVNGKRSLANTLASSTGDNSNSSDGVPSKSMRLTAEGSGSEPNSGPGFSTGHISTGNASTVVSVASATATTAMEAPELLFSKDGYSNLNDNGNSLSQLNNTGSSRLGTSGTSGGTGGSGGGGSGGGSKTKPITNWFTNANPQSHNNATSNNLRSPSRNDGTGSGNASGGTVGSTPASSGSKSNMNTSGVNVNVAPSSSSFSSTRSRRSKQDSGANNSIIHNGKECVTVGVNTINAAKEDEKIAISVINNLKKRLEMAEQSKELAESKASRIELELKTYSDHTNALQERNFKLMATLQEVYKNAAIQEARRKREVIANDCVRLGRIATIRMPANKWGEPQLMDIWKEGYGMKDLRAREGVIFRRKTELENRKKALATLQRSNKQNKLKNSDSMSDIINMNMSEHSTSGGAGGMALVSTVGAGAGASGSNLLLTATTAPSLVDMDIATEQETLRYHSDQIKQEEASVAEERRLLEADTASHQKELKRLKNEDDSDYIRDLRCLHKRYQLQSLLGKGGFSEVWRAVDLLHLRDVAVKVHKLNPGWAEDKKNNYIKHVTREYQIHKEMQHPRIVQLYDVFEIDDNSFATVLEYCRGIDLDEKLKRCRTIPEKDAKPILMQIVSGLRYLNTPQLIEVSLPGGGGNGNGGGGPVTSAAAAACGGGAGTGGSGSGSSSNDGHDSCRYNSSSSNQNSATALVGLHTSDTGMNNMVGVGMTGTTSTVAIDTTSNNNNNNRIISGSPVSGHNNNNNNITIANTTPATTTVVRRKAIIHYDLKPANILFDEFGDAKITDFGLSKVVDDTNSNDGDGGSVELTSIGAGTYWYLPPECFITPMHHQSMIHPSSSATVAEGSNRQQQGQGQQGQQKGHMELHHQHHHQHHLPIAAPRISSKVDVWSVGVIFYQMLFGKRPFGEGKSQEVILKEGTMLSANAVEFPQNPKVSEEAKEFIRACLAHNQHHRPDVHALSLHPYLCKQKK